MSYEHVSPTLRSPVFLAAILAVLTVLPGASAYALDPSGTDLSPDKKVYSMLDIPLAKLRENPEHYSGMVFEDWFKFYRIYHNRKDADPALRGQVIVGDTHFTARPVQQALDMVQIVITPDQEARIHELKIRRQDAIKVRLRFKGIAPGEALAFDLVEILEAPKHRIRP